VITKIAVDGDVDFEGMSRIKEDMVTSIKEYLYSGVLKHPTGQLAASMRGYVIDNIIFIYSDKDYAQFIDTGRKPHIMWYLLGKTIPINGVFRRCTIKSINEGKWHYKGYEGVHYIDVALRAMNESYPMLRFSRQ
jgi:hypothetical protein